MGAVVGENEGKVIVAFEDGGVRTFKSDLLSKGLTPVELPPAEARGLSEKLSGRKRKAPATLAERKKLSEKAAKATAARAAKANFQTFEQELAAFDGLFPGGFQDPSFISDERGVPGSTGKDGLKEAGIALVQAELSAERFQSASPEELFQSAQNAIQLSNIAFPIEGAIAFKSITEADRPAMLEALKDLLHGTGDYGQRFDRYAQSLKISDKSGKAKTATWPLVTLLPALHAPAEHVAVKPTVFAAQAALLGEDLQRSHPVNGEGYKRFLTVAKTTRDRLVAAGKSPRDLMDVYSFIYRAHAIKPAPKA